MLEIKHIEKDKQYLEYRRLIIFIISQYKITNKT